MTRSIHVRLLSICALALGATALFAGSAQAAEPAWMVNGANVTTLEAEIQVASVENGTAALLAELLGNLIKILCTTATLSNVKTLAAGQLTHGKVLFHNCKFFSRATHTGSWVEQPACEPFTELAGGVIDHGLIETEKGKGHLALHEGHTVTVIEPLEGVNDTNKFVTINLGEECAFGEAIPVIGKLVIKDCNNAAETEAVEHLIEEEPALTELFVINLEHRATLDGSALLKLVGAHLGKSWSGLGG